jgi:hypothetical protein
MNTQLESTSQTHTDSSSISARAAFVGLTVLFIVVFRALYTEDLSPLYSYTGLTYNQPSLIADSIAWLLALMPALFLRLRLRKPSDFILWLLYICVYIPSLFVPLFMRLQSEFEISALGVTLLLGLYLMAKLTKQEAPPIRYEPRSPRAFWIILWTSFVLSAVWIIAAFGSSLRLVALSDVYSSGVRLESREVFDKSLVGFAVMMMFGAVNPLMIALGLQKRSKFLTLCGIGGQVLCYSAGGFKSIAFSLMLLGFLHLIVRKQMQRAAHTLMAVAMGLLLSCHLVAKVTDTYNPAMLMVDATISRAFVMPGQLMAEYSDFFVTHPHLHLSNTKPFSWFMPNPLNDDVIFAVTEYYGGQSGVTSNGDFWAEDGIGNFGLPGVIAVSILTGFALLIVDRISASHDPCFSAMAFSFAGFNLANAPLTTTLLSGGLMLSIFLLMLAPPSMTARESITQYRRMRPGLLSGLHRATPDPTP